MTRLRISDYVTIIERCQSELSIGCTGTVPESITEKTDNVEVWGEDKESIS